MTSWAQSLAAGLLAAVLVSLTLLLSPQPLAAAPSGCAPIPPGQAEALFTRWNDALQSGDAARVTALYGPDALLLPTLSAQPRQSPEAIQAYFEQFLRHSPQGRIESRVLQPGCNTLVDAGTYSFLLDGSRRLQARYTFVYHYEDGEWHISHHHSSLEPDPPAA